jgi:cysteine desulfurase/selenocysteine lyase
MTAALKQSVAPFDPHTIRPEFPILSRQVNGQKLVYLDNAASAQKPRAVIGAMTHALEHSYANVHRGLHTLANEATQVFEGARADVARLLGADAPERIVFTRGTTEAINLVASSFGQSVGEGDEIVLSTMEHHSNIVPWHFLRELKGAVLKWVPVLPDGALDMDAYAAALGPRTKIVAITHMSNVLGTKTNGAEIVRLAHAKGIPVLLDGSQGAVHGAPDVMALGVDFYTVTGHKLYGPTGVGALYAAGDWLQRLPPYQGGGEMIESVSRDAITYAQPPHKFEAGTPAIVEAIGFGAAARWLMAQDRVAIAQHENRLLAKATEGVLGQGGRVHGTTPHKGAILAFSFDGAHPHDLAQLLDRYGVAVRAGQHCAEPLMRELGVHSTARASFAAYNTEEEVDIFLDALNRARSMLI